MRQDEKYHKVKQDLNCSSEDSILYFSMDEKCHGKTVYFLYRFSQVLSEKNMLISVDLIYPCHVCFTFKG